MLKPLESGYQLQSITRYRYPGLSSQIYHARFSCCAYINSGILPWPRLVTRTLYHASLEKRRLQPNHTEKRRVRPFSVTGDAFWSAYVRPSLHETPRAEGLRKKFSRRLSTPQEPNGGNARRFAKEKWRLKPSSAGSAKRRFTTTTTSPFGLDLAYLEIPSSRISLQRDLPISRFDRNVSTHDSVPLRTYSSNAMQDSHSVIIALGSNVGDRIDMIEQACRKLDEHPQVRLLRSSSIWETQPMYVEDQGKFLNAVCEVSCSLALTKARLLLTSEDFYVHGARKLIGCTTRY